MKKIFFLGIAFALFTIAASAQQGRSAMQHQRIEHGFKTGQLNRAERFRLQKNQHRYHQAQRKVLRDGRLAPFEKRRLYTMKRHNSREIFRYRHNGRGRII